MKRFLGLGAVTTLSAAVMATISLSANATDYTEMAPVVSTVPVYERINTPKRECWTENQEVTETSYRTVRDNRDPNVGGAIFGALLGGVIGHQVGKGTGKDVATGAGAALGAVLGSGVDDGYNTRRVRDDRVVSRPVERCQVVDGYRDEVRAYDVTYRYNGRDQRVRLPYDPGPYVRVSVGVVGGAEQQHYRAPRQERWRERDFQ